MYAAFYEWYESIEHLVGMISRATKYYEKFLIITILSIRLCLYDHIALILNSRYFEFTNHRLI